MRLGEICEINMGQSPKSEYYNTKREGLPFLQGNRTFGFKYPTFDTYTIAATKIAEAGDVIMSVRAPVGDVNITPVKMCLGRGVCALRHKENEQEYLYYLMRHYSQTLVNQESGTVFGSVNRNDIANLEVKVHPLAEQKQIGQILANIDNKIANNTKINHHLEQMAQEIFKSWFVDFEPFADDEFVESELGQIPKGWQATKIVDLPITVTDYVANGSFASLKDNVNLLETSSYAIFVRNIDLKSGSFNKYVDEHSYRFLSKSALFGGEVIISNVGDVGSVFLCPYLPQPMTLGNNMIMLTANNGKAYNYFFYLLFKHSYGAKLIQSITGGSAQPKFNKTDFRSLRVIVPSTEVLGKFCETIECLFQRQADLEQESARLVALRDALLPRLMSGEIEVPIEEE